MDQVVTFPNVHTLFGQWRASVFIPVFSGEDVCDPVSAGLGVGFQFRAQKAGVHALHALEITPVDIGVTHIQLTHHLTENEVQVRAVGHVFHQGGVFIAHFIPVDTVHVGHVEPVPVDAPAFIEDLLPLQDRVDFHGDIGEVERARAHLLVGLDVNDTVFRSRGPVHQFLSVRGYVVPADAADHGLAFFLFQVEPVHGSVLGVYQRSLHRPQATVVARGQGEYDHPLRRAGKIDTDRRFFLFRFFLFILGLLFRFRGLSGLLQVVSLGEDIRSLRGQWQGVDPFRVVVHEVELEVGKIHAEVALGDKKDIFSALGKFRSVVVEAIPEQALRLVFLHGVQP